MCALSLDDLAKKFLPPVKAALEMEAPEGLWVVADFGALLLSQEAQPSAEPVKASSKEALCWKDAVSLRLACWPVKFLRAVKAELSAEETNATRDVSALQDKLDATERRLHATDRKQRTVCRGEQWIPVSPADTRLLPQKHCKNQR